MSRLDRAAELLESLREASAETRARLLSAAHPDERAEALALLPIVDSALEGLENPCWGIAGAALDDDPGPHMPLGAGVRLGGFEVIEQLGEGGMGVVYRAMQIEPRRPVALKLLRPGLLTLSDRQRFRREAQALARLRHPGIAAIHAAGEAAEGGAGPLHYIAMELVEGQPITEFALARSNDIPGLLELLALVCDAVEHAHAKGVIHRDLKPSNILVDAHGAPKLLDFGVARLLEGEPGLTETGHSVVGTYTYMSPEQLAAQEADTRSDIYSLGIVAYQVLTGRLPYEQEPSSILEAAMLIPNSRVLRPTQVARGLPADLEPVLLKALEREPSGRYQSAGALAQDLRRVISGDPVSARRPTARYLLARFARRRKGLVAVAAVAALATLTALGLAAWQFRRAVNAERAALQRLDSVRDLVLSLLLDIDEAVAKLPDSLDARRLVIERALSFADLLAESVTSPADMRRLADAYTSLAQNVGAINHPSSGDFATGVKLGDAAVRLYERLIELQPTPENHGGAGWAYAVRGSLSASDDELYAWHERAIEAKRLALEQARGSDPTADTRKYALDLAYELSATSNLCADPSQAVAMSDEAHGLYADLVRLNPADVEVAMAYGQALGESAILFEKPDPARSERLARQAIEVLAGCIDRAENPLSAQRHRAFGVFTLSRLAARAGRIEEALDLAADGLASAEAIYRVDPANLLRRRDYVDSFCAAGHTTGIAAMSAQGERRTILWAESQSLFDRALREADSFAADVPLSPWPGYIREWVEKGRARIEQEFSDSTRP